MICVQLKGIVKRLSECLWEIGKTNVCGRSRRPFPTEYIHMQHNNANTSRYEKLHFACCNIKHNHYMIYTAFVKDYYADVEFKKTSTALRLYVNL